VTAGDRSAVLPRIELGEGEFADHVRRARRSGSPAWLWPEVPISAWAEAVEQLARVIATILRSEIAELPACDPLALSLACYTSGTGPLLGWWSENGLLVAPPSTREVLDLHLQHGRKRAERAAAQSRAAVALFAQHSIPVIVLKGGHTSLVYFPHPATRPATDLDLLVPSSQAAAAEAALMTAGFHCLDRGRRESSWAAAGARQEPRSLWLAHAEDPWSIDLHCSLDFSASPGAATVRLDGAKPFATSEQWLLDPHANALRQPLLLLHLAVHASGGLHSLSLLRMIEQILVVRRDTETGRLSWKELLETGAQTNALGSSYPAFAMCEQLAPGTIPEDILRRCAEAAPSRARKVVERLTPASAQRVARASILEHLMWVSALSGWARQLRSDLIPARSMRRIYEARAWRLLHGTISR
jgi:hypothetical protein